MNMVRAGAVRHPSEWVGGAYAELTVPPAGGRFIDRDRLLDCLLSTRKREGMLDLLGR
jgi:putative transposase